MHTAEGIPQLSIMKVICVPGTPRTRQGYHIDSCGYTKTNVKDPYLPTIVPQDTHTRNTGHLTEKVEKTPALITLKVEKGRIQHLPAGYDACQTQRQVH